MPDAYRLFPQHYLLDDETKNLLSLLDVQHFGRSVEAFEEVADAVRDLQERFFVDLLDLEGVLLGLQSFLPLAEFLETRA